MKTETHYQPPSKQTHFLVTGGGKGITAENVCALAKAYHSKFTLVGRSALLKSEPDWAVGLDDEAGLKAAALADFKNEGQKITPRDIEREVKSVLSSREINKTLAQISQFGGSGEYLQADITDLDQLTAQLGDKSQTIDGVIHGAGALADKYIQDKTEADFDLVYGVKVAGLKNVLRIIQPEQLHYLILFSSVAGFYGNAGQADYSLANEILNKLAHHLKQHQPECQVLSIGWGPWDGGMVTPQLKRIFERSNIPLISPADGSAALVELMSSRQDNPQYVIGNPLPKPPEKMKDELRRYVINRDLSFAANPFLADHVIGGNPVLPTVCAVAWFIGSCESLYPDYQFFSVRDYRVFKGIVLEHDHSQPFAMEIEEIEKDTEKLIFRGKVSSESEDGKKRFHYQAEIELRKILPERPKLEVYDLSPTVVLSGSDLYQSKVLFHGPSFQGIEQVLNIHPQGLTSACRLPASSPTLMGQFAAKSFDPILADVHLQSLLVWAHHQKQTTGLPLRIGEGIQYQKPPQGEPSYATMQIKSITPHKLVADVISHDKEGLIYTKVIDAEITLNEGLAALYQQNQLEQVLV